MRKKTDNQLSIFDIEFPQKPIELPMVISAEANETELKVEDMQNLCPYRIPTIEEIMKHIKSAVYRVDTHQLISDVFFMKNEFSAQNRYNAPRLFNERHHADFTCRVCICQKQRAVRDDK